MKHDDALPGAAMLEWAGERLHLLPERALWWPAEDTLFVADLHLGKGDVFRASGIPIPSGTTRDDLARLSTVARETACRRLVILGDFFHGRASQSGPVLQALRAWRDSLAGSEIVLVRGNHDRSSGDPPEDLDIRVVEAPYRLGPFVLRHEPSEAPVPGTGRGAAPFELAGHLHPVVRLQASRRDRLRVPCFWIRRQGAVLPAFGGFTGGGRIRPGPEDRVFVAGEEEVVEVPLES